MEEIRHRVGIQAPRSEVLAKLTTIDGLATWWTRDVDGDPDAGGELRFYMGSPEPRVVVDVVEATDRRVVWRCTVGPDEWVGGTLTFDIDQPGDEPNGEETVLKFTQTWREPVDFMFHCSTKWAYFLLGLKASLEGGKATPFPDDLKISSWGVTAPGGDMDAVFKALADPSRRRMLDSLNVRGGQNLMELCVGLDMARQSVSKHLAVLEAANLVTTVRRGREKLHYLNAAPINEIEQRWINQYDRGRVQALGDLKIALEGTSMQNRKFVYTTYVNATPELVWKGLTDPAFTSRYWGLEFITDWKVGSPITWVNKGITIVDPEQRVLEADPFRRLSYTWHSFTPELAEVLGIDEARQVMIAAEPRSQVAFDIEPVGEISKLTVVHEFLEPDTIVASMVSQGWPRVVAELKTLLETGEPLTVDLLVRRER